MVLPLLSGGTLIHGSKSRQDMQQNQTDDCLGEEPISQVMDELGKNQVSQIAKVLTLLAEGRPLPVGEVASSLLLPLEDAKAWLEGIGAEFDSNGSLVGLGLTSVPTPHKFQVNGHSLYAWCAGDTLVFPAILGKTAEVESTDPISGVKIRLTSTPNGVQNMEPNTAVLSWPTHADASDIRGSICYQTLWFASPETAQKYASKNGGMTIRTPAEFREEVIPKMTGTPIRQEERLKAPACHPHEGSGCN